MQAFSDWFSSLNFPLGLSDKVAERWKKARGAGALYWVHSGGQGESQGNA